MKTALRNLRNSKGFNTIELMVGLSILAVVVLAGATLSQVADKSTQYADRKQEFQALSQMIMEHLKNGESCISALNGQAIAGANPNAQNNGNGNAYGRNNPAKSLRNNQERQIAIFIDGLQVGTSMDGDILDPTDPDPLKRQILPRRLQVNNLSISNARLLNNDGTNSQFLVQVNLQVEEIGGMSFKEQMIGMTTITANNTSNAIVACEAMPADAMKRVCESDTGMGCVWDPNSQPNCRCLRSQVLCAAPGYYPVSFENGIPNCRPLGGKTCPAGEFLVGVGIDQVICAPVPNSCPAGTSQTGAGNPVAGLSGCKCDLAGQTYVSGSGCQVSGNLSNGACGTANGGTTAAAPTNGLCSVGSPTAAPAGSGPWTWTCSGVNGGSPSSTCTGYPSGGAQIACSDTITEIMCTAGGIGGGMCESVGCVTSTLRPSNCASNPCTRPGSTQCQSSTYTEDYYVGTPEAALCGGGAQGATLSCGGIAIAGGMAAVGLAISCQLPDGSVIRSSNNYQPPWYRVTDPAAVAAFMMTPTFLLPYGAAPYSVLYSGSPTCVLGGSPNPAFTGPITAWQCTP